MTNIHAKYARLLVRYSLGLKKGEKLLISSTSLAAPLIREVYREALLAGGHPETMISIEGTTKSLYDYGDESQLTHVSPMYFHAVQHYDALLTIRAPFNVKELEGVEAEKKRVVAAAQGKIKGVFRERAASGSLKWTLCEYPTHAQAQESGLSLTEYEGIVIKACFLDNEDPEARWRDVHDGQESVVGLLNSCSRIRFVAKETDVTFSTAGRRWINSDGRHNMPSGEVFTSPVEDSVEGVVRFSYPGIFMGQEIADIRLELKKGEVVTWRAEKGGALLDSIMAIPGMKRFGEAAIGTNQGITRFTKNMLYDEKMAGTIHMALGSSYPETGGINESPIHWDLLADMKDGGEIYADGKLIYRDGRFVESGNR